MKGGRNPSVAHVEKGTPMKWARGSALLIALPAAVLALPALLVLRGGGSAPYDPVAWAQVSSCGNAILEPGEDCDPPGSLTCPSGSPSGAMLPCNADCTCPAAAAALDHFQCYALKSRAFSPVSATIEDQFGTLEETIRGPIRLCAPSGKDGEGIVDPTDHLVAYEVKPPKDPRFEPRRDQTVVNQFGTQQLDVLRPSWLLVPSGKDGVAQTPPLDHFQCYVIKRSKGGPKFVKQTVTVSNQFEDVAVEVELVRPFRLCAPASKNGEDPTAPDHPDHLLCYKTKSPHFGDAEHTIDNQFDQRDVKLISRNELCVPSQKNPGTTTTTTSSTSTTSISTTTSSTVTTTTVTTTTSTTATAPTTTSTTTTSTTTTTLYGSPARAFLEPSGSLLD